MRSGWHPATLGRIDLRRAGPSTGPPDVHRGVGRVGAQEAAAAVLLEPEEVLGVLEEPDALLPESLVLLVLPDSEDEPVEDEPVTLMLFLAQKTRDAPNGCCRCASLVRDFAIGIAALVEHARDAPALSKRLQLSRRRQITQEARGLRPVFQPRERIEQRLFSARPRLFIHLLDWPAHPVRFLFVYGARSQRPIGQLHQVALSTVLIR